MQNWKHFSRIYNSDILNYRSWFSLLITAWLLHVDNFYSLQWQRDLHLFLQLTLSQETSRKIWLISFLISWAIVERRIFEVPDSRCYHMCALLLINTVTKMKLYHGYCCTVELYLVYWKTDCERFLSPMSRIYSCVLVKDRWQPMFPQDSEKTKINLYSPVVKLYSIGNIFSKLIIAKFIALRCNSTKHHIRNVPIGIWTKSKICHELSFWQ